MVEEPLSPPHISKQEAVHFADRPPAVNHEGPSQASTSDQIKSKNQWNSKWRAETTTVLKEGRCVSALPSCS